MSITENNLDAKGKTERTIASPAKIKKFLIESQKKYQDFIETNNDFIWEMDTYGKYTYCSPQMEKLWGLKSLEMVGKSPFDMMPPSEKKRMSDLFMEMGNSPKPIAGLQTTSYDSQSHLVVLEINGIPYFDDKGRLLGFRGTSRDITERKKTEQFIIESEAKYRDLVNLLPEMVFEIDSNGNVTFANARAFELTKYSKEDFQEGFNANNLVAQEDIERSKENMKKMFAGEMRQSNEYMFVAKDGARFPVLLSSSPIIKDGMVIGARGVAIDVAERKKAENALRIKEERYCNLANSLPEIVFETDINGKLVFANKNGFEITGYTEEDLAKGIDIFSLIAPQDKKKAIEHFTKTLENKPSADNEFKIAKKDGGTFPAIIVTSLIVENKRPVGLRGLVIDITERKKLEKQMQDQERFAAIGATAGMVGHDIRNPLQTIVSELFLARQSMAEAKGKDTKEALESIDMIQEQVDYIDKIVSDLQDYARPLNPQSEKADIEQIVEKLLAKNGIPANIEVSIKVDDGSKKINVDSYYLSRIMYNLVINAVQAMPKGGKLTIQTYKEEGDVIITVKDNGVGIPKEVQTKMFTLMFTTKAKGQGFGLPVVKRMTESIGGTVSFESQEGKGTTFMVKIPLKK